MSNNCKRGDWTFVSVDSFSHSIKSTYSTYDSLTKAHRFWATRSVNGKQVRVARTTVTSNVSTEFFYYGDEFCIGYKIVNSGHFEGYTPDETRDFFNRNPIESVRNAVMIDSRTWVNSMTLEQYEQFLSDVLDDNLYDCLFDCIPDDWAKLPYPLLWDEYRLVVPIRKVQIFKMEDGSHTFQPIEDMVRTGALFTKDDLIRKLDLFMNLSSTKILGK